ncbi:MAG: phosphatase PAP2 family protein [Propionibacteriaceae bacterium]
MSALAPTTTSWTPTARSMAGTALGMLAVSGATTAWLLDGVYEHGDLSRWDRPTLLWLVSHRAPLLTSFMTAVSVVGGEVVVAAVAALVVLLLAVRRRWVEAFLVGLALTVAESVSLVVKHVVDRARPPAPYVVGTVEKTLSFPSGHTIGTATLILVLAYVWWRSRRTAPRAAVGLGGAALVIAVVGLSRLYLGDHWLTDVCGSVALSLGVMAVVVLANIAQERIRARRRAAEGGLPRTQR